MLLIFAIYNFIIGIHSINKISEMSISNLMAYDYEKLLNTNICNLKHRYSTNDSWLKLENKRLLIKQQYYL